MLRKFNHDTRSIAVGLWGVLILAASFLANITGYLPVAGTLASLSFNDNERETSVGSELSSFLKQL